MQQKRSLSIAQTASQDSTASLANLKLQKTIRERVNSELRAYLQSMVSNCDNFVAQLVKETQNIGDQAKINEAMHLLRLQQKSILKEFLVFFDESYAKQLLNSYPTGLSTDDYLYNNDINSHALMEQELLEIRAAVDKMAEMVKRRQWQIQSSLTKRFSALTGQHYDVNNYPISAWLVCDSFAKVVRRIKTRLSKKLIIIKLFEYTVIPELEKLYQEIDDLMVENEVALLLENDNEGYDVSSAAPIVQFSDFGGSLNAVTTSELDCNVRRFVAMQQMLHSDSEMAESAAASDNDYHEKTTQQYSVDDVMTGLSVLQEKILMLDHTECIAINSNVKPHLFKLLNIMSGESLELDRKSSDVIDIVSMMFDYILDDVALPLDLRTIIIRLQVPIIKVAILDDEFFNSRLQSARQLLNEFAYSANVLHVVKKNEDDKQNAIIVKVTAIVDKLLKKFATDTDMFAAELQDFQQFMRTVLKGRKESTKKIQIAKDIVVAELKQRLLTQDVPHVVDIFIKQVWNEVLTKVGLGTQCEGKVWRAILQVTDDLIWSTQPKLMVQERQLLTKMIPKLLSRLQDGLKLINYSRPLMDQFFRHLEKIHLNSLRGMSEDLQHQDVISLKNSEAGYHYAGNIGSADMASVANNGYANHGGDKNSNNHSTFVDPQASVLYQTGLLGSDPILNPSYVTVSEMKIGTWVAFSINNQTSIGKLEWKCDFTEEYRFVDRNFTIVHSANLKNLVKLFDQSKAKVIDDIPLFDRAVDAVYHELQVV